MSRLEYQSVLAESEMSPVLVVITHVLIQQPSPMSSIQHADMIQEISTDTANPALGDRMADADLKAAFGNSGLEYVKIGGESDDWNAPGIHAVFASCKAFALLAFRGTDRKRELSWWQTAARLHARPDCTFSKTLLSITRSHDVLLIGAISGLQLAYRGFWHPARYRRASLSFSR